MTGCVRGLCSMMRAIIMYDDKNNFWSAVTDADDKTTRIYYYTNDPIRTGKLPQTIQKWIDEIKDDNIKFEIVYKNKR